MAVQVKIGPGTRRSFIAEIVTLPATVILRANNRQIMPWLVMGLIFTTIGYVVLRLSADNQGIFSMITLFALGFGTIGSLQLAKALFNFLKADKMTFHDDFVEVKEKGLLKSITWREDYSNFKGIRHREKTAAGRLSKDLPYQIIELVHKETSKTLPLYAVKSSEYPIDHIEHYADILDVETIPSS